MKNRKTFHAGQESKRVDSVVEINDYLPIFQPASHEVTLVMHGSLDCRYSCIYYNIYILYHL